ncbi:RWD-domain-containing protein [Neoconidiobolus thromboides FSU 785]|nr:RWD-domain-containing protein [Neoconidiobolus thromboides FSU 785]
MNETEEVIENELLALSSIYESDIQLNDKELNQQLDFTHKHSGLIKINIQLESNYKVYFNQDTIFVKYLPPIFLCFELGDKYPKEAPSIKLICFWLSKEDNDKVKDKLKCLWEEEKAEILFIYIDFIQNYLLEYLNYLDGLTISKVNLDYLKYKFIAKFIPESILKMSQNKINNNIMKDIITQWDYYLVKKEFNIIPHSCGICWDIKRGRDSISLKKCSHVYCKQCLSDFFKMMIREGLVYSVLCPHEECRMNRKQGKINIEEDRPDLEDIRELLSEDDYNRYLKLFNKQKYDMDPLSTWCPIESCNTPMLRNEENEKLCICIKCHYAYCHYCKRTWHGSLTYCELPKNHQLGKQYHEAKLKQDNLELAQLELKYGLKNLQKFAKEFELDLQFNNWKLNNAQPCPKCLTCIEKSHGCNHMICAVCDTHFCYSCGQIIDKYNPYKHFNDIRSTCHMLLFEGVQQEEFEFDPFDFI